MQNEYSNAERAEARDLRKAWIELDNNYQEMERQFRALVTACNEYGGGASISHPRYTRQLSAARKFLENISDLPKNRDWLNPDVERAAKELLKEYKRL